MRNRTMLMLTAVALAAVSGVASAHDLRVGIGFNLPAYPVTYVSPARVTYIAGPVYAPATAQVVYYSPAPQVYYGPQVRYVAAPSRVVYVNSLRTWRHYYRNDHFDRNHW